MWHKVLNEWTFFCAKMWISPLLQPHLSVMLLCGDSFGWAYFFGPLSHRRPQVINRLLFNVLSKGIQRWKNATKALNWIPLDVEESQPTTMDAPRSFIGDENFHCISYVQTDNFILCHRRQIWPFSLQKNIFILSLIQLNIRIFITLILKK